MSTMLAFLSCALTLGAIEKNAAGEAPSSLLTMKRVFVDRFGGGETAAQMRDMVISSLENAKLFVITENQERADAILRGSSEDLVFSEQHSTNDSINAHANSGSSSSDHNYSVSNSQSRAGGISVGESESSQITERRHEASAAVRLVNSDGDVIWSTTKESFGGKFRGSSADVADKIVKQLVQDIGKARASSSKQAGIPSR